MGVVVVGGGEVEHLTDPDATVGTPALQHDADPATHLVRMGGGIDPQHADPPGGGAGEPLTHLDSGGFAGAVGSQQCQDGAAVHGEGQAVDGGVVSVTLHHIIDNDGGFDVTGVTGVTGNGGWGIRSRVS